MPADRDLASYADLGDAALGALVAERDGRALETLYDRYGTACFSLARRIAVDTQLAQDVVPEVFLTFWHNAGRFDGRRGSLSTYLLAITHHKSVDAVRKEERQRSPKSAGRGPRAHRQRAGRSQGDVDRAQAHQGPRRPRRAA